MSPSNKNALFALLEKGSGMAFALGSTMLLLRRLDKPDFAAWGFFLLVTYTLEMARSGLIQNGLVREIALHRENAPACARAARAALWLNFGFSLLSNLMLWVLLPWIVDTWKMPQLAAVFPVYFAGNFVMALLFHFNFLLQAQHDFRGIFQANFFWRGALFVWIAGCATLGGTPALPTLAWAMTAGAAIGALSSWTRLRGSLPYESAQAIPFRELLQWMGRLIGYGKWVLGTNLSTMLYKNADRLVLGYLVGSEAFAVYDAAGKLTQLVEAPSFSIAAVVFPLGAARMATHGKDGVRLLYERSVGAILAIILPFIAFILLFAKPVMVLFAGKGYLASADVLAITAFFGLFLPFAVQFGTILDATGIPQVNFGFTLFTALLNLGLSWQFIEWWGWKGAAFATLTGYACSFLLMQWYLYKRFGIKAWNAFGHIPGFYRSGWEMLRGKFRR